MKNFIIAIVAVFTIITAQAQEAGKVRVGMDLGGAIVSGGGGILFNIEPKYNLADNMNLGLRFGLAAVAKNINTNFAGDISSASISASSSFMGTYDYYFVLGGAFNPFVGGGLGYVTLASVSVQGTSNYDENGNYKPDDKLGLMVRGGFEAAKFRLTLEFDMIGKSTLKDFDGREFGSINNNYLGITAGFYIGGGRW